MIYLCVKIIIVIIIIRFSRDRPNAVIDRILIDPPTSPLRARATAINWIFATAKTQHWHININYKYICVHTNE